jgi:hypothetical protein
LPACFLPAFNALATQTHERNQMVRCCPQRVLIVLAGIVLGQFLLYGPSLLGLKVLLPLDILTGAGVYIPRTPDIEKIEIQNVYLTDLVYVAEPVRKFLGDELRAGRWPLWMPYQYAGTPAAYTFFSPLLLLQALAPSPVVLAWACLLVAVVAGLGAYVFFRRALEVGFWASALIAWCYPLSGFFVFWQNFPTSYPVALLPWALLAINFVIRDGNRFAPVALVLLTALVLIIGNLDVAGQVLLGSGLFALWALGDNFRSRTWSVAALKPALALTCAWALGFLIASPHLLPLLEYSQTGSRLERRGAGEEERPPAGISALPQVVLPDLYGAYGTMKTGTFRIAPGNQQESSAATYCGLLATLFLAPLAWCNRRHRSTVIIWVCTSIFALGWSLNLPGIVDLLRAPGLNLMSHNRFVFLASFGLLALAALGLDWLLRESIAWRQWMWIPCISLGLLGLWCLSRAFALPEPIATQMDALIQGGRGIGWVRSLQDVQRVQDWFIRMYTVGGLMCLGTAACWILLKLQPGLSRQWLLPLAILLPADMLWFASGRNVQGDWSLYYPPVPALQEIARTGSGRIIGYKCLPPQLAGTAGLSDVRGYDAVDPSAYVELLGLAAEPDSPTFSYALTQWLQPKYTAGPKGDVRLSPILDLLGVRYVLFRGTPPSGTQPAFSKPDYWALTNSYALPRAFIPEEVQQVADKKERLEKLGSPTFDPRRIALVEEPIALPGPTRGTAQITRDTPNELTVEIDAVTTGLLVLADRWDPGWHARLNNSAVPILRADHALRGVVVPAGKSKVEFTYRPVSLLRGIKLAGIGSLTALMWLAFLCRPWRESKKVPES